jgi:Predicted metal-dependent phosphoesterases (PHP family)
MDTKADLHLHTTASDGKLSPEELVSLAESESLDYIAVTDHDTTEGIPKALLKSKELSLNVIPGIELSTQHNGETVHILGYFKNDDYMKDTFQKILLDMKLHRLNRGKKIIENLKKFFNIELDYDDILKEAKGVIARPHIARAIIKSGYDYEWEYIFNSLIGKNSPAYVPNKKLSTVDGIKLLKSVNALVILAHPILIKKTSLDEMLKLNFDGLEAVYWQNPPEYTEHCISMALGNNMLITGGSDFHGGDAGDSKHGFIGKVNYEAKYFHSFIEALEKK